MNLYLLCFRNTLEFIEIVYQDSLAMIDIIDIEARLILKTMRSILFDERINRENKTYTLSSISEFFYKFKNKIFDYRGKAKILSAYKFLIGLIKNFENLIIKSGESQELLSENFMQVLEEILFEIKEYPANKYIDFLTDTYFYMEKFIKINLNEEASSYLISFINSYTNYPNIIKFFRICKDIDLVLPNYFNSKPIKKEVYLDKIGEIKELYKEIFYNSEKKYYNTEIGQTPEIECIFYIFIFYFLDCYDGFSQII